MSRGEGEKPISIHDLRMDAEALNRFLEKAFPRTHAERRGWVISAEPAFLVAGTKPDERALRPGGLISGPTQMGFADMAAYALILSHIGPVAMAVTSALHYQFLRPCLPGLLTAKAEMLKLGKKLAVMDVRIYLGDDARAVGQASVTYAIP